MFLLQVLFPALLIFGAESGSALAVVAGILGTILVAASWRFLQREGVVDLDEERRASMVSNLLVVLCSEQQAQPIVNTGSLYG